MKFGDPRDVQKLIESLEEFDVIISRHPEADIKMIDFMDQKTRSFLEAYGKVMGILNTTSHRKGSLERLTDRDIRKIIYDLNKAKSYSDMVAKIQRITFNKDGSIFILTKDIVPQFYNALVLFNSRFLKTLDLYAQMTSEKFMPGLRKVDKVKGLMDYYFKAIPGGDAILEQMSNEGLIKKRYKTMHEIAEATLKYIDTKRKIALEYNDIGRMLAVGRSKDDEPSGQQKYKKPATGFDGRNRFARKDTQRVNVMENARDKIFQEWSDQQSDVEDKDEGNGSDESEEDDPVEETEPKLSEVYDNEENFEYFNEGFNRRGMTDKQFHALQSRASHDARKTPLKGCYKQFIHGKCDDAKCQYDHTEQGMMEVAITKVAEVFKSSYSPKSDYMPMIMKKAENRAAEMKAAEAKQKPTLQGKQSGRS